MLLAAGSAGSSDLSVDASQLTSLPLAHPASFASSSSVAPLPPTPSHSRLSPSLTSPSPTSKPSLSSFADRTNAPLRPPPQIQSAFVIEECEKAFGPGFTEHDIYCSEEQNSMTMMTKERMNSKKETSTSVQGLNSTSSAPHIVSMGGQQQQQGLTSSSVIRNNATATHSVNDLTAMNVADTSNMGFLRCDWNPTIESTLCEAKNVIINTRLIKVSKGNEPVTDVRGRIEDAEFPVYASGVFQMQCVCCNDDDDEEEEDDDDDDDRDRFPFSTSLLCNLVFPVHSFFLAMLAPFLATILLSLFCSFFVFPFPLVLRLFFLFLAVNRQYPQLPFNAARLPHHFNLMMPSFEFSSPPSAPPSSIAQCTEWVDWPVFIVTRYEYANLYHTMTGWSSFASSLLSLLCSVF